MALITTIIIIVLFLGGVGAGIFWYYRRILREAKNYERGLKMVPLLIHLPPASDDIEVGGRDARDIVDETISQAQVLYNIISSTATKGFKAKFYGQRHFAFEIISAKGSISYYCAVPVALVDVVKQAVVAAYPTAQLEESTEHNLFSPNGNMAGTIGGELTLKQHFAYPIATFQESKRDAMQAILNALSALEGEDGAGIQFLLRPAHEGWSKSAVSIATKKKKTAGQKGSSISLKDLAQAPFKPLEVKENKPEDNKLSNLDQALIDSIEEKTRHPAYEVLIRIVASSNTSARSQAILKNVVAAFALFDAPGRNGFKLTMAKDMDQFVTAFIFRFFSPEVNQSILNSVELATIFHLPDQRNTPTSQLQRQFSKQVDGPNNSPKEGMLLGYNVYRGLKKEIRLDNVDRRRHVYIIGQTGTGKSNLLENLALQDMLDGKGFAFIDPHGDVVETLLNMVPKERVEDVVYFSPGDMEYPMGLNLFEFETPEQKDFLIQEAINMLYKLYDPGHTGIIGPRYEHWFRNAALTIMSDPEGASFIDIPKVFNDNEYAKQKLKFVTDHTVLDFWNKEMAQTSDYHKSEVLGWFVSKFGAFLSNEMMRNIIGQTKSSFNLREIMDNKKILLVNLGKGKTGELNSKLLGMIFVMKFQVAAMSRVDVPEDQREDFTLYVDEFQNFATESFADILAEARKFRLSLIVANQFMTQLTDQIREAVIGNVGTVLSLRVGTTDAEMMIKKFSPVFDTQDLVHLPNFEAIAQVMINNVPSAPFSMALIPRLGNPNPHLGLALKRLSSAKYGRPRKTVEKEIFERLRTSAPAPSVAAKPASDGQQADRSAIPRPVGQQKEPFKFAQQAAAKPSGSSFLDEWLAKRRQQQGKTPQPQQQPVQPIAAPAQTEAPAVQVRQQAGASVPMPEDLGQNVTIKPANAQATPVTDKDMQSLNWINKRPQTDFKVIDPNHVQRQVASDEDAARIAGMMQKELKAQARKQGIQEPPKPQQNEEGVLHIRREVNGAQTTSEASGSKVDEVFIDNKGNIRYDGEK